MQQPMAPQSHPVGNMVSAKKKSLSPIQITIGAMLFAVAILVVLLLVFVVVGGPKDLDSVVKKDKYQAVFLDSQDGQVYFGKLSTFNNEYYKLTDIYYVRVEQSQNIQPENSNQQPQQNISLAKLGNELHGPEDEMFISRDKVLFWENLKEDGQVVKAIREYQKNPDAANQNNNSSQSSGSNSNSSSTGNGNTNSTSNTTTNP